MAEWKRKRVRVPARRLKHNLHVRPFELRRRAYETCGLEYVARQRPAAKQRVLEQVHEAARCRAPGNPVGLGVLHLHEHGDGEMIVIIAAHARQVMLHLDAVRAQCSRTADSGEHEQLRRKNGAAGNDDFASRPERARSTAGMTHFNTRGAAALEHDAQRARVRENGEVAAMTCGLQIRRRG